MEHSKYYKEYQIYKKKYLELKKKIQSGGNGDDELQKTFPLLQYDKSNYENYKKYLLAVRREALKLDKIHSSEHGWPQKPLVYNEYQDWYEKISEYLNLVDKEVVEISKEDEELLQALEISQKSKEEEDEKYKETLEALKRSEETNEEEEMKRLSAILLDIAISESLERNQYEEEKEGRSWLDWVGNLAGFSNPPSKIHSKMEPPPQLPPPLPLDEVVDPLSFDPPLPPSFQWDEGLSPDLPVPYPIDSSFEPNKIIQRSVTTINNTGRVKMWGEQFYNRCFHISLLDAMNIKEVHDDEGIPKSNWTIEDVIFESGYTGGLSDLFDTIDDVNKRFNKFLLEKGICLYIVKLTNTSGVNKNGKPYIMNDSRTVQILPEDMLDSWDDRFSIDNLQKCIYNIAILHIGAHYEPITSRLSFTKENGEVIELNTELDISEHTTHTHRFPL